MGNCKGVNINPYAITKSIHEKGTKAYIENENRGYSTMILFGIHE